MASCILDAIGSIKTEIAGITWDWSAVPNVEKPKPTKLFQKVLMWNNQVERLKNNTSYLVANPACYLEMRPERTEQLLDNVTLTDVCWRLHIVYMQLDAGDDETLDETLYAYTIRDAVRQAMVGFQPTNCSTMFYTGEEQDYDHDNIYHYVVEFKTCFRDTKGSVLDPDQTRFIYTTPPTNLQLETGFDNGDEPPITPHISYIWKVCEVSVTIVGTPDPDATILLANGVTIPAQYSLNMDGTVTIPYLASTPGICLLAPFLISNQPYPNIEFDNTTGNINNLDGGFEVGDTLQFNASLPLGVDS